MTDEGKSPEQLIAEAVQQDLVEWRTQPFTKRVMNMLKARRLLEMEQLARGTHNGKNMEEAALFQAKVCGRVELIEELLRLNAIELLTIERDIQNAEYFRM